VRGAIPEKVQSTIGADLHSKIVTLDGDPKQNVKLSFYDTAGEEKFRAVTACHYRNAKGAIIVYDVTCR